MPWSSCHSTALAVALAVWLVPRAGRAEDVPSVVLRWQSVPSAAVYEVQVAADPAFALVVAQARTPTSGYRWQAFPAEPHYWRVRSIDRDGRRGQWSAAKTIAPLFVAPELRSPEDGATVARSPRLELQWSPAVAVKLHRVEVALDPHFRRLVVARTVPGDALGLELREPRRYFWRVLGVDGARLTAPGEVRSFRLAAPVQAAVEPKAPAPDARVAAGRAVDFAWTGRDGSACRLEIGTDPELASVVLSRDVSDNTTAWVPEHAGTYYWRVSRADGASGQAPARRLTVVLESPRLLAPPEGARLAPGLLALSWQPAPAAAAYRLEVDAVEARPVVRWSGGATTHQTAALAPGSYVWRVRAEDGRGGASEFSAPRQLVVEPPSPSPPRWSPQLQAGAFAGVFWNVGALRSGYAGLEVRAELPQGGYGLGARVGYYTGSRTVTATDGGLRASARLHAVPIELVGFAELAAGTLELVGGLGLNATPSWASVAASTQPTYHTTAIDLGGVAFAGVQRRIGPGEAFGELSYTLTSRSQGLVATGANGLHLVAGYRVSLW